jgi:hypothetical protein
MNRKLLPYERGLCQQLGLSEDDYLLFLAAQRDYALSGAERLETLRGEPTAIVLFVVGVLMQVGAALLAPKPEVQKQKYQRQLRDKSFAPRSGFNGTQELARYGDPINLVYCNDSINPKGAVRVATSLLWSSVESTGTGQYMQLLLLVGASNIKKLDFNKTAFGQLPARQFSASNTWMYYSPDRGPVEFSKRTHGDDRDPAAVPGATITHLPRNLSNQLWEGYSQAYTPTTATELGVYAPIPIHVDVLERDQEGKVRSAPIGIAIDGGAFQDFYNVGDQFQLRFNQVDRQIDEDDAASAKEAAKDLRLQLVNNLDRGAIYRLGSANFKMRWVDDDMSLNSSSIRAGFECTEPGRRPTTNYDRVKARQYEEDDKEPYEKARKLLKLAVDGEIPELKINGLVANEVVEANLASAHAYVFRYTAEQLKETDGKLPAYAEDLTMPKLSGLGDLGEQNKNYLFTGERTLTWTNDLDENSSIVFPVGGSVAFTQAILKEFLSEKPKLSTKKLRQELRSDRKKLRRIRDRLMSGGASKQLRKYIIATDPTAIAIKARIKELNDLLSNDLEELNDVWKAEAKQQPTAIDLANQIAKERENFEVLSDADASAKRLARIEKKIETLREQRKDFIDDYIAQKRRQNKRTRAQLKAWRDEKSDKQQELNELINDLLDDTRENLLTITRESTVPFDLPGISQERFACGLDCIDDKLEELNNEKRWTPDLVGVRLVKQSINELIAEKRKALAWANDVIKNWNRLVADVDDSFYCKALVKMSKALYQTVTSCNQVRFNFRVRLFRRISGRAKTYGEHDAPDGYKLSDNGVKRRTMFFSMLVRNSDGGSWLRVPQVFAVERGNDADHYITLMFESANKAKREFRFIPVVDPSAEIKESGYSGYAYIHNAGSVKTIGVADGVVSFYGRFVSLAGNLFPDMRERGPNYTNEWDMFSVHSDTQVQASYDNGPEAKLVNVTEQTRCPIFGKYQDMSLLAFHTYASNGVEDLRSITAYVQEGKSSWKVADDGSGPYQSGNGACYAPDIFADTVMDATNGIKNFANANAVDWDRLALAKRFCKNNGLGCQLFMDGVIADRRGWREFWVEAAPFSLLEFARMNGKETLVPALPVTADGRATTSLTISALFNEGNILEDSYREEYLDYGDNTKDLVATVIYREITADEIFARNTSVTLCRSDTNTNDAIWQTFDLSDWVSQKEQAVLYGRMLCQQRRYVQRTIEFKTVPTDSPVQPGAYIFVDIGLKRWDSVRTGVVQESGVLDLPLDVAVQDGVYTVMTYNSESDPQVHSGVAITNGVATNLNATPGSLFVLGNSSDARRVFRVTDVALNEDAEITVRGVEHPCVINGGSATSLVADLSAGLFKEIGVDCG